MPLVSLLATFSDVPRATEWMDRCNASSVVEDRGDFLKIVYNRTHGTWPVSDRDAVLRNDVYVDAAERRVRIEFVSVEDPKMPPQKGVVRMPRLRGHWYLWPESGGRTRVEYQVFADPGGALPDWLVNYVSRELPRKTIVALAAQVKRRPNAQMEQHLRALPQFRELSAPPALAAGSP